ncbi:DUF6398 domain-containing protein [Methylobacter sp.]|uniref:DUF6398 domain-containing protein n=1 Tax=Methylobacter sp. TaxID=2051955 RepID=UPI002489A9EC|nr:DUF6398 domain-containing protein [Methylobacter sp.]MDI1276875.1 DUF6398 domain-containing protein [Methylobacter sp.]MDI1357541.1 DUF6398 domain-containing protein [Methylobacter sp.]
MTRIKQSENVPKPMQEKYKSIVEITDSFAKDNLNEEYAQLIRYAVAALCRKRPSPLATGKASTWACGITHAIGMVNFLFDKSQAPHINSIELYKKFGIGQSTGQGKSKLVRDMLGMNQFDPNWMLPSKFNNSPLVWMLSVNGMMVDIRYMPREVQEIAFEKGLIPYIPDDRKDG